MRKAVILRQVAPAAGVPLNAAAPAIREDRDASDDARAGVRQHHFHNAVGRHRCAGKTRLLVRQTAGLLKPR